MKLYLIDYNILIYIYMQKTYVFPSELYTYLNIKQANYTITYIYNLIIKKSRKGNRSNRFDIPNELYRILISQYSNLEYYPNQYYTSMNKRNITDHLYKIANEYFNNFIDVTKIVLSDVQINKLVVMV